MLRYYILFEDYEQGLALHDWLDEEHIVNRIAPAPAAAKGKLCCGMSLLIEPDMIDRARACIEKHSAVYYDIVPLTDQLQSRRDKYC